MTAGGGEFEENPFLITLYVAESAVVSEIKLKTVMCSIRSRFRRYDIYREKRERLKSIVFILLKVSVSFGKTDRRRGAEREQDVCPIKHRRESGEHPHTM